MKVIDSIWFANGRFNIGIVAVDSDGHGWKCYIGNVEFPSDEETDAEKIAERGMPTGQAIALGAFPHLKPEEYLR